MHATNDQKGSIRDAGELLRDWRQRRHLTQLALASEAGISTRLLGAMESGQSLPNRDMLLRLTERLQVPLRDRNALLIAAGYDAEFPMRVLGDPVLTGVWSMIEQIVANHTPYPALAIDRHWSIVASNEILRDIIAGADPALLSTPVNWARLTLHPAGLAPRIANLSDWYAHATARLRRQFDATGDAVLSDLLEEVGDYPVPPQSDQDPKADAVAVPLRLMTVDGPLSFYCASTVFCSAVDVTLAEVTIETFYPADSDTAAIMRQKARPATIGQAAERPKANAGQAAERPEANAGQTAERPEAND